MGLRKKYQVQVSIYGLTVANNKASYESGGLLGTEYVHMQSLDPAYTALIDGNLSKSFVIYAKLDTLIKVGMKLVVSTGELANTYFVKEARVYEIGSKRQRHKKFIIEQKDV